MSDIDLKSRPQGATMRWKDTPHPTVYSNIMGFAMTPFDISFVFGEIGDSEGDQVTGIPRVKLTLSPEQVANLAKLASIAVTVYSQTNGQLRTSAAVNVDEITEQITTAAKKN